MIAIAASWAAWAAGRWALVRAAGLAGALAWARTRTTQVLTGDSGVALGLGLAVAVLVTALALGLWWIRADAARDARAPLEIALSKGNAEAERHAADLARRSREAVDDVKRQTATVVREASDRIVALERALAEMRDAPVTDCTIPRDVVRQMRRPR